MLTKIHKSIELEEKYKSSEISSCNIQNYNSVYDELFLNRKTSLKQKFADNRTWFRDLREPLKELFGNPTFYFQDGERNLHCHAFSYKEKQFLIITAAVKGTSYETLSDISKNEEKIIIEFLNEVKKAINQYYSKGK